MEFSSSTKNGLYFLTKNKRKKLSLWNEIFYTYNLCMNSTNFRVNAASDYEKKNPIISLRITGVTDFVAFWKVPRDLIKAFPWIGKKRRSNKNSN